MKTPLPILAHALLAGAITAVNAQAQSNLALEEIVVTAQKRQQSLQDVPIAVTALSEDFIIKNDIRSLEDLAATVPGLVTTNSASYGAAPLSIRGIGGANGGGNVFADEPVAVYIDDVYIGRLSVATSDLLDMQSVEVLRGPQGTLYGRNSTAGAIILRSARPTEEFEAYIRATAAEDNEYRLQAVVSGPLSETLQGRLALSRSDRQGYAKNSVSGDDIGGSEDSSARLSLRWQANEDLRFDLIAEYLDQESNAAIVNIADISNPLSSSPFDRRDDLQRVIESNEYALNDENSYAATHKGLSLLTNWELEHFTVDSVTAYRKFDSIGAQDSDSSALSLFYNNGEIANQQFSQELRFSGEIDTGINWIAGAFYFSEDIDMNFDINNVRALFGLGTHAQFKAKQSLSAYAIFADATWDINDRVSLIFGGRYSNESKDFNSVFSVDILNGGTLPAFSPILPGVTLPAGTVFTPLSNFDSKASYEDFSPRLVINAQINDEMMAYASYSKGFTSGGFNAFGQAQSFESQEVDAFEVGLKSDLFESRFRLNLSAFFYQYDNLQLRLPVPTGGVVIDNAAAADIKGIEIESTYLISEHWTLTANLSLLDTEFTEGSIPAVPANVNFPIGAPIPLQDQSIVGNQLSRAPESQFYLSLDYTQPWGDDGEFNAQLSVRYQDEVFFSETNQDQATFMADAFVEADIRFAYINDASNWEIAIYGQNLFDERHITQVSALGSYPSASVNEPRKWGIQISKKFY